MIVDRWLSNAQAIGADTNALASTSYKDFGAATHKAIDAMWLVVNVETAVTRSAGAATVTFKVETDDNSSFSSATTLLDTGALAKATLVDGYNVIKMRVPANCEQYLRVTYTASAALDTGKIDALLVMDADQ
jgi:hypothetical protein